jgi:solute carrier family 25 (mitochondrial folate transporter), member 32
VLRLLTLAWTGTLTAICTNPVWVIKTRMLSTGRSAPGAYQSLTAGVRHIIATEGPKGFYRGLIPSVLGISHGAFQFMFYEQLKARRSQALNASQRETQSNAASASPRAPVPLSNSDYLYLSGLSKLFAGSLTYPFQVVRARLQTYDAGQTYASARDAVVQLWRQEGFLGLYKG